MESGTRGGRRLLCRCPASRHSWPLPLRTCNWPWLDRSAAAEQRPAAPRSVAPTPYRKAETAPRRSVSIASEAPPEGQILAERKSRHGRLPPRVPRWCPAREWHACFIPDRRPTPCRIFPRAQRNPFRTDSRRAVVVASDEAFGMARMYGSYSDSAPDQFRVFRELGSALEWVGLDPAMEWPTETPHATFG